ncbi:hypothetical protein [Salmonella phage GSW6]|uniref:Uncharacterized protein n=1 Tax=Salmonella phage GSW6 TaxID=3025422 RepID=A0AAE9YKS3_9CAUD|nr:hypothetical protein [Salmonella phage GSW6]
MKDGEHIVKVDVMGFNFHASTLKEVVEQYELTPIQVFYLKQNGELILHEGKVTLTYF